MPRRPRKAMGGLGYHVLNRGAGRMPLCAGAADDAAFDVAPDDWPVEPPPG